MTTPKQPPIKYMHDHLKPAKTQHGPVKAALVRCPNNNHGMHPANEPCPYRYDNGTCFPSQSASSQSQADEESERLADEELALLRTMYGDAWIDAMYG